MKAQLRNIAVVTLVVIFTSCGTTNSNTTTSKSEQTERRVGKQGGGERPNAAQMLEQMDTNNDGKISKDEAKGPLKDGFSKIDTDSDGFISKEELEKAPKPERRGGKR
ncbi:EF-hand domain-containing protein [Lacinutrix mariniflava]|uniref:EF-hand domain-containing protein n=1 Tax=Lacinutrix mariniflava TaxID=342955 RepID=UPI0006E3DD35|nr:EF-hand domain-containing protein [Lacinutrix mariniflava]